MHKKSILWYITPEEHETYLQELRDIGHNEMAKKYHIATSALVKIFGYLWKKKSKLMKYIETPEWYNAVKQDWFSLTCADFEKKYKVSNYIPRDIFGYKRPPKQ